MRLISALRRHWAVVVVPAAATVALVGGMLLFFVPGDLIVAFVMDRSVIVDSAWARPPAGPGAPVAVYLDIAQIFDEPDRLVGVSTPAARTAALRAPDGATIALELTGKEAISFKPGGRHVVLSGLTRRLEDGDSFPLTLRFAGGDVITTRVRVRARE